LNSSSFDENLDLLHPSVTPLMVGGKGIMDGIQKCATYNPRGASKPGMENLVRISGVDSPNLRII
jgi:hypothetical protein